VAEQIHHEKGWCGGTRPGRECVRPESSSPSRALANLGMALANKEICLYIHEQPRQPCTFTSFSQ
jgi:hypothetical protein